MRSAVRVLAGVMVAAVQLGGCTKWLSRGEDAGVAVARPRGPATVPLPQTADGWRGVGTLWQGAANDSHGAVLLVHQLGSNRSEWGRLVERLQRPPAVTVLAIDLRGHGDSVQTSESPRVTWESFGEDATRWAGVARDVEAGARYLFDSGAARSLVVVGSGIGASAAVAGLANEPRVAGLAMISPGVAYHGLDIRASMEAYMRLPTVPPRTAWMTAGDGDVEGARALATLVPWAPSTLVERRPIAGADAERHGVSLLNADATNARWDALNGYIRATLLATRRAAAVPR